MVFVEIGGMVLYYEFLGDLEVDCMIVFVNFFGIDFCIWLLVFDEFDDDIVIFFYDKCGYGFFGFGKQFFLIEDYVQDVINFCVMFGIDKVVFCGFFVGGFIVQGIWKLKSVLVEVIIFCDIVVKIGIVDMWNGCIVVIEVNGIVLFLIFVLECWFMLKFFKECVIDLEGYCQMFECQLVVGYNGVCVVICDVDFIVFMVIINVLVFVVVGDQDGLMLLDFVCFIVDFIFGVVFEIIKGCGYIFCVEQFEVFVWLILCFLLRLGD